MYSVWRKTSMHEGCSLSNIRRSINRKWRSGLRTSVTFLHTSVTFLHTSATIFHTSVTILHTSATILHTSATILHTSVAFLHTSVAFLHTSVTFLHTSVTFLHTSVTFFHTSVTFLHTSVTFLHTSATFLHTSVTFSHVPSYVSHILSYVSHIHLYFMFTAVSYQMFFHWCSLMYPHWGFWNKLLDLTWNYLPTEAAVELITSLILSRLVCCNSLLSGLPASDPIVFNVFTPVLLASLRTKRKTDHSTPMHQSLHWLPVLQRIQYKIKLHEWMNIYIRHRKHTPENKLPHKTLLVCWQRQTHTVHTLALTS